MWWSGWRRAERPDQAPAISARFYDAKGSPREARSGEAESAALAPLAAERGSWIEQYLALVVAGARGKAGGASWTSFRGSGQLRVCYELN